MIFLAAAAGCGVAGGSLPAVAATSASSGTGQGEIVYETIDGLYAIAGDGSNSRPLDSAVAQHSSTGTVSFSMDGTHVAYADEQIAGIDRRSGLVVSSPDGTDQRTVWSFVGAIYAAPAWNRAGTMVAVTVQPGVDTGGSRFPDATKGGLWVVGVNGGRPRRVAAGAVGVVAWSPNGKTLAYATNPADLPVKVEMISASGGKPEQLASFPGYGRGSAVNLGLSWSADGRTILVDSKGSPPSAQPTVGYSQVEAIPVAGGPAMVVLPRSPTVIYSGAMYSPDGFQIAVSVGTSPAPWNPKVSGSGIATYVLKVANANGSQLRQLRSPPIVYPPIAWVK